MSKTRITVLSSDREHLKSIAETLRVNTNIGPAEISAFETGSVDLARMDGSADVMIINGNLSGQGGMEAIEQLGQRHPGTSFIVITENQSPEFLLQAMRAGVREVLPMPMQPGQLQEAILRIRRKRGTSASTQGKILAFVSCKGGSGATFLATNLGYALAEQKDKRVALIDLNLQFGDASLFVSDSKPPATLTDIAQQIHRLDASFLALSMLNVAPNYGVLAAPEDPAQSADIKPDHIEQLLKLARQHYDFILLDVGRNLDAVSIRALDQADMIFPILQTTLPYIRDGKRLLSVFRSLDYPKDRIHLVVNRHEKNGDIKLKDLQAAFGTEVYRTVPNHYEAAAASVNQGVPIVKLAKNSPVSRSLLEFARGLIGQKAEASQGWLSRVLQRA